MDTRLKHVQKLHRELEGAKQVIDDLVRENYELAQRLLAKQHNESSSNAASYQRSSP